MASPCVRSRGIVLILVSALLTLIAILAAGMLNFGRAAAQAGEASRERAEAMLGAASGLDYAAARLWQDWRPVWPKVPETAGDDWKAREASVTIPLEGIGNPSYSHGDRAGIPGGDLDGNGRIDAASGRLRGAGRRFLLRVVSHAGLVCVNGGELGNPDEDQDADDVPNGEDPDYLEDSWIVPVMGPPNGVPDWRDVGHASNAPLVNLLNNLGAIAGLPPDPGATYAPPAFWNKLLNESAPYRASDLGRRVVSARPRGGYRSLEDLRPVLGADYDMLAPYLSVWGEIVSLAAYPAQPAPLVSHPARIDFNAADRVVVEAALRYLSAGGVEKGGGPGGQWLDRSFVRLLPDEAGKIAEELVKARPLHSWKAFLQALVDMPDTVFENDPFITRAESSPTWNPAKDGPGRRRPKEDLILAQMDIGFGWALEEYRARRRHLDVVREGGAYGVPVEGTAPTRDIRYRREDLHGGSTAPFFDEDVGASPSSLTDRSTAPFSLAPHRGAFRLECRGWASGAERADAPAFHACGTDLFLGEELRLATQADFEQFMGWLNPSLAPAPRRLPGGIVIDAVSPSASRAGIQSWPLFPATTCQGVGWSDNGPRDGSRFRSYLEYYTGYADTTNNGARAGTGWLELGARQWDDVTLLAAKGVFPFNEDGTPLPGVNEYGPARDQDNFLDPTDDDVRDPDQKDQIRGGANLQSLCPMGPTGLAAGNLDNRVTALEMGWLAKETDPYRAFAATPFPRGVFDLDPGKVQEVAGPTGEVGEGTVGLWVHAPDNEPPGIALDANRMRLDIDYCGEKLLMGKPTPYFYAYLTLFVDPFERTLELSSNGPAPVTWTMPLSAYQAEGWRFVAVTFHRDLAVREGWGPDDTAVIVWVDGLPVNASTPFRAAFRGPKPPLDPDGVPPVYDEMRISLKCADPSLPVKGIDDLFVMGHSLSLLEMKSLLLARRQTQGRWRSSRFRFDASSLPDGARVAGYAWDAFVPDGNGAEIRFTASVYDEAGGIAKAPEFPHAGSGPQAVPTPALSGRIASEFDWGCAMSTASPATPILDEFRVFYTPGNAPRRGAITTH